MGCSSEKTKDEIKADNNKFPVYRSSIPFTGEIDSMVSFDSKNIVLGAKDELNLLDLNTNTISAISKDVTERINCLIKLPDGKIVSGGQDSNIKIWDIKKKECVCILKGHTSMVWDIKILSNNRLISGCDDNTSKIWNLKDKTNQTLFKSKRHISSIAVLKNNKVILAEGKNLLLFNLDTKDQESCLILTVWTLKELKNGDVAAGLGDGNLYILEITDEINIKTKFTQGHKATINTIIELANGKLVTSSDENDLILWDRNDPESIYLIKGHTDIVTSLCLIEGNKFATASRDNTIKIWE